MGRKLMINDVPLAPFTLVNAEPMRSMEVFEKLNRRRYLAARGATSEARATLDPTPCPDCGSKVEWAYTFKRDPALLKGGENYIYARCKADPERHRWGFRNTPRVDAPKPTPPKAEIEIIEETPAPQWAPAAQPTPEEKPVNVTPAPKSTPGSLDAVLGAIIEGAIGSRLSVAEKKLKALTQAPTLDPEAIKAIVKAAIEASKLPQVIEVHTPVAVLKVNGIHHPILDEMLERYALGERTFMLVGPKGTGKTTIAEQFMRAIGAVRYSVIPCSEDKRLAEYIGWRNMDVMHGTSNYQPTSLVEDLCASLNGPAGTIFEEFDGSGANVLLGLNTMTNGYLCTPDADMPMCPRGPDYVMICTANTFGTGANLSYAGRNQLDAATLDRYRVLFVNQDRDLELAIIGDVQIVDQAFEIRGRLTSLKMKRDWSVRDMLRLKFDRAMKRNAKAPLAEITRKLMASQGWSPDEITRALP